MTRTFKVGTWSEDEVRVAEIYARWISGGQMTYYKAMKEVAKRLGRHEDACRHKLRQLVAAVPPK